MSWEDQQLNPHRSTTNPTIKINYAVHPWIQAKEAELPARTLGGRRVWLGPGW